MAKKKKEVFNLPLFKEPEKANELIKEYNKDLESNPKYSLLVDPEKKYNMSDKQKTFVKLYIEYKNLAVVAKLMNISIDDVSSMLTSYSSQEEIRRINMAMYHRRFSEKLLTLDEIGGFLSTLITDKNVPNSDQLSSVDKIKVAQMIIELNQIKIQALDDPSLITEKDIEDQIKDLSIGSIKQLINQKSNNEEVDKESLVKQIDKDNKLSGEELAYLRTLSAKDLLQLLESINKGE